MWICGHSEFLRRSVTVLAALILVGCGKSNSNVATLESATGGVDRMREQQAWVSIAPGSKIRVGDWARTKADSEATFDLRGKGRLLVQPSTTIRFLRGASSAMRFDVDAGKVVLEAGSGQIDFETALGIARLQAGSAIAISSSQIRVELGRVTLLAKGKAEQILAPGALVALAGLEVTSTQVPAEAIDAGSGADDPLRALKVSSALEVRIDGEWQPVGEDALAAGAHYRVQDGSVASISRGGDRLSIAGPAQGRVEQVSGSISVRGSSGRYELKAKTLPLELVGPWGRVQTDPALGPALIRARIRDGRIKVWAVDGSGRATSADGESTTIRPGTVAELGASESTDPGAPPDDPEVTVPAGESAELWVPDGKVAVRVVAPRDCGDGFVASVRRGGKRPAVERAGLEGVTLDLTAGTHPYRLTCIALDDGERGRPGPSGTLKVLKRKGTATGSRRPARSMVDADGRLYEVHYQNRLPDLTFRWQAAKEDGSYELRLNGKRSRRRAFTGKSVTLRSGSVPQGRYTWRIVEAGDGTSSPEGELHLSPDESTPAASVSMPTAAEWKRGRVAIRGQATSGWGVQVDGVKVALDRAMRFRSNVDVGAPPRPVVVRLSHARHGVRYYVRRP